jgi:ankyrin repeat protein
MQVIILSVSLITLYLLVQVSQINDNLSQQSISAASLKGFYLLAQGNALGNNALHLCALKGQKPVIQSYALSGRKVKGRSETQGVALG